MTPMKNAIHLLFLTLLFAFVSCAKSGLPHELKAQFPALPQTSELKIACLDLREDAPSADKILSRCKAADADLLLLRCDASIDGAAVASWLSANAVQWGHSYTYAILSEGRGLAVTAVSGCFAESLSLNAAAFALVVEHAGLGWVLCDAAGDDLSALAYEYRHGNRRLDGWVVFPTGPSDILEEASFTDCLKAQWGGHAPIGASVLYASGGIWNRMGTISEAPLSFVMTLTQERL